MRPKVREILEECIEIGIERGYGNAYKHIDNPTETAMSACIELAIWYEIDQRFDFERNLCIEVVEGFDRLEAKRNKCNDHPDAPHGFDRGASLAMDRYVCECESWEPEKKNA